MERMEAFAKPLRENSLRPASIIFCLMSFLSDCMIKHCFLFGCKNTMIQWYMQYQ